MKHLFLHLWPYKDAILDCVESLPKPRWMTSTAFLLEKSNTLVRYDFLLVNPYWLSPNTCLSFMWWDMAFRGICSILLYNILKDWDKTGHPAVSWTLYLTLLKDASSFPLFDKAVYSRFLPRDLPGVATPTHATCRHLHRRWCTSLWKLHTTPNTTSIFPVLHQFLYFHQLLH